MFVGRLVVLVQQVGKALPRCPRISDAGRAEPDTPLFDSLKNVITKINNWDIQSGLIPTAPVTGGAALQQRSRLYNTEAQWDLSKQVKFVDLLIGADARIYEIIPDGNNFVDFLYKWL